MTAIAVLSGTAGTAAAALPPGNAAQQWDQIAEDTVVGSGAFQGEGFVYMAYVAKAMHGAVSPGERKRPVRRTPPSPSPPTASWSTTSRPRRPT